MGFKIFADAEANMGKTWRRWQQDSMDFRYPRPEPPDTPAYRKHMERKKRDEDERRQRLRKAVEGEKAAVGRIGRLRKFVARSRASRSGSEESVPRSPSGRKVEMASRCPSKAPSKLSASVNICCSPL